MVAGVIGGSDQDIDLAQQFDSWRRVAHHHGRQESIKQFAAIAKKSVLFVGSDSGAMHIASAVGTPVVALFGPSALASGARGGLWRYSIRSSIAQLLSSDLYKRRGELHEVIRSRVLLPPNGFSLRKRAAG